jgi:hypothetical protein
MMSRRPFRCIALLGVFAVAAVLTDSVVAQPAQPRVVQSGDGTLYLVQGGNAWPLVPDQISDEDLAVLNLGDEVDGALPANLLNTAATTPPPAVAVPQAPALAPEVPPAGPAAAVPQTPAPPPAVVPDPAGSKRSAAVTTPTPGASKTPPLRR